MTAYTVETYLVVDGIEPGKNYKVTGDLDGLLGLPLPKKSFTGLYGRGAVRMGAALAAEAERQGKQLLFCQVEVDAGVFTSNRVDLDVTDEERQASRFLSDFTEVSSFDVNKGRRRILQDIENRWCNLLLKEGIDPRVLWNEGSENFPGTFTTRPDLVRALCSQPPYDRLDSFIYTAKTPKGEQVRLCTVFNPEAIRSVTALNDSRVTLTLPKSIWSASQPRK